MDIQGYQISLQQRGVLWHVAARLQEEVQVGPDRLPAVVAVVVDQLPHRLKMSSKF